VSGMVQTWRGVRELVLLGALWSVYSLSRLLASADLHPATERAKSLLGVEKFAGIDIEMSLNRFTSGDEWLAAGASYYYAAAHYLVTAAVLLLLWFSGNQRHRRARNALVLATVAALTVYILLPTAPPRLLPGYIDTLAQSADQGWWGRGESLPGGLGRMTNELAAMPTMHAGWALWVALTIGLITTNRFFRALGWTHAGLTALVVIGTGNHWVLDVLVGWLVVGAAWALVGQLQGEPESPVREEHPEATRSPSR
jgi:hypothetical protein